MPNQEAIWEYYQSEGRESFTASRTRLRHLVSRICKLHSRRPPREVRVLNIGVGGGIFEEEAARAELTVFSLDPSRRAIEEVASRLSLGDRARVGSCVAIPFDEDTFDVVVVSEVLEHLDDEELDAGLMEMRRVLRPGGHLLGTVPAREKLEASTVVCPRCELLFHRWGHRRSFTPESLGAVLDRGYEPLELRELPFIHWPTLNWKGKVFGLLKLAAVRFGVHGNGESLVFLARARTEGSAE